MVLGSSNFVSDTSCAWKCEKLDISSDLHILHVFTTFALCFLSLLFSEQLTTFEHKYLSFCLSDYIKIWHTYF